MSSTVAVRLSPSPGFCIKSSSLQPGGHFTYPTAEGTTSTPSLTQVAVPQGLKVFLNIAWDKNVPPPPEGSEDVIQRTMQGEDGDVLNPDGCDWFVPVIVSCGREDTDKGQSYLYSSPFLTARLQSRTFLQIPSHGVGGCSSCSILMFNHRYAGYMSGTLFETGVNGPNRS